MILEKYNTIILDCDGVVFDSNLLKVEAFKRVLNIYGDTAANRFVEYFKENFGTSRYRLVKIFIEDFLEREFSEAVYSDILKKYGQECVKLYQEASLTKGFFEFIEAYENKNIYIASGGDEKELLEVFRSRKLDQYFLGIFGSPRMKDDIVSDIVRGSAGDVVMIGDALADKKAAIKSGIDFFFMRDYSTSANMRQDGSLQSINNLKDLI